MHTVLCTKHTQHQNQRLSKVNTVNISYIYIQIFLITYKHSITSAENFTVSAQVSNCNSPLIMYITVKVEPCYICSYGIAEACTLVINGESQHYTRANTVRVQSSIYS